MTNVGKADTPSDKVDVVFLSMLGRYPTESEKTMWLAEGESHGRAAIHDLIWTLANTSEFVFIQ